MKINDNYLRSGTFGVEDALVSTTGLIIGMSVGVQNNSIVLLAGFVAISVEAISMAAGEYLSEHAVDELEHTKKDNGIISGTIMFFCYFIAGLIPILPFLFLQEPYSQIGSAVVALIGLTILGWVKAKIVKMSIAKSILEVVIIGGVAAVIGIIAGILFKV